MGMGMQGPPPPPPFPPSRSHWNPAIGMSSSSSAGTWMTSSNPDIIITELENMALAADSSYSMPNNLKSSPLSFQSLHTTNNSLANCLNNTGQTFEMISGNYESSGSSFGAALDTGNGHNFSALSSCDFSIPEYFADFLDPTPPCLTVSDGLDEGPSTLRSNPQQRIQQPQPQLLGGSLRDSRTSGRGMGYRKLWQQVTRVSKGQKLADSSGGLAFSEMTVSPASAHFVAS